MKNKVQMLEFQKEIMSKYKNFRYLRHEINKNCLQWQHFFALPPFFSLPIFQHCLRGKHYIVLKLNKFQENKSWNVFYIFVAETHLKHETKIEIFEINKEILYQKRFVRTAHWYPREMTLPCFMFTIFGDVTDVFQNIVCI